MYIVIYNFLIFMSEPESNMINQKTHCYKHDMNIFSCIFIEIK